VVVHFFRLGELRTTTLQITRDVLNTATIVLDNADALNSWLMANE
jgi:hypothetical protein